MMVLTKIINNDIGNKNITTIKKYQVDSSSRGESSENNDTEKP